eukprot:TRINITY_DN7033_c0_g1_i1.p1 TRINITY_DN7033_c0_g1~~TRINITY_DN7033_c0_g1_i1.p1  ORF type:complete len:640 (+),score=56.91 TRINITY_DN7033_c0_g1_i1:42-1961(+)
MSWQDLPPELVKLVANDLGFSDCRRLDMACKTYFTSSLHWSCISSLRDVVPSDEVDSLCEMFERSSSTALRSIELEFFPERIPAYAEMSDKIVTAIANTGVGTRLESLSIFETALELRGYESVSNFATMGLVATFSQLRSLNFSYVNSSTNKAANSCDQFSALTKLTSLTMHLRGRANLDVSFVSRLTNLQTLRMLSPNPEGQAFAREPFAFPASLQSLEFQYPLNATHRSLPPQLTHLDVLIRGEGFLVPDSLPLESLAIRHSGRFRLDQIFPSLPTSLRAFWCCTSRSSAPEAVIPVVSLLQGAAASLRALVLQCQSNDFDFSFLTYMTRLNVLSVQFPNRRGNAYCEKLWKFVAASKEHLRIVQLNSTAPCEIADEVVDCIEQSAHHLEYISLPAHSPRSICDRRWRNSTGVSLPLELIIYLSRFCQELDLPPVCASWMCKFPGYCLLPKRTPVPQPGMAIRVYGMSEDFVRSLKLDTTKLSLNPLLCKLSAPPLRFNLGPRTGLNGFDFLCSQMPAALIVEVENTSYSSALVRVFGFRWACPTKKEYEFVYIRPRRTFRQLLLDSTKDERNGVMVSYRRPSTPSFMQIHSAEPCDTSLDALHQVLRVLDSEDPLLQRNPFSYDQGIELNPTLPNS